MERLKMMQRRSRLGVQIRSAIRLTMVTLAVVLVAGTGVRFASASEDAGSAGAYMRYGASARSLSLGNAVAGICDDVATSYWNGPTSKPSVSDARGMSPLSTRSTPISRSPCSF